LSQTIETIFLEERRYPPPPEFAAQANAQLDIYERGFEDFWESEGRERVTWFEPFTKLLEWEAPYARWYLGGKLNVCFNCVDRHVESGFGDKVAFHWEGEPQGEGETITFAKLQEYVVQFANVLKSLGVKKGTPVGIYKFFTTRYRENPYEIEARRAVAETRGEPAASSASVRVD
jgi:acetyl-CoA synthetase